MKNPCDPTRFIYFFPDCPHLMKLFRNHLLDKGFGFLGQDGKYHWLGKKDFIKLLHQDCGVYRLCPKLENRHIEAKGSERQIVRLATQLLSDTVAKAMKFLGNGDMDVQVCTHISQQN